MITDITAEIMAVPGPDGRIVRNWIFVQVHTDAGIGGIGEATTESDYQRPRTFRFTVGFRF